MLFDVEDGSNNGKLIKAIVDTSGKNKENELTRDSSKSSTGDEET